MVLLLGVVVDKVPVVDIDDVVKVGVGEDEVKVEIVVFMVDIVVFIVDIVVFIVDVALG